MSSLRGWSSVIVIALLCALAPLVVSAPLYDQIVLPRLALVTGLTGLASVSVLLAERAAVRWREVSVPAAWAAIYIVAAVVATAFGADPWNSVVGEFQRYQGLLPTVAGLSLMAATAVATAGDGRVEIVLWGLFAGAVLAAGYGLLDSLGFGWIEFEVRGPDRVGGLFVQPNVLGTFLVTAAVASAALLRTVDTRTRTGIAAGIGLMAAVAIYTFSRAAWVAGVVGVMLVLVPHAGALSRIKWLVIAAGAALALALLVFATNQDVFSRTIERGISVTDAGGQSTRLGLWKNGWEMFIDRPILGWGPDSFSSLFPRYREEGQAGINGANVRPESSHNAFIDQMVSTGIVGTLAFAALVAATVRVAWLRAHGDVDRRGRFPPLAAALATYLLATFFAFTEAMTAWLFWVLLGCLLGMALTAEPRPKEAASTAPWRRCRRVGRAAVAAWGAALITGGAALWIADLDAGHARDQWAAGEVASALARADDAATINPFNRLYADERASIAADLAAETGDVGAIAEALRLYDEMNTRFEPTAPGLIAEAHLIEPGGPDEARRLALLEAAAHLDPYNAEAQAAIASERARITH